MTTPTDPPNLDALTGDAPQLGQSAATFDANANTLIGQLPALQTGINAVSTWTNEVKTWTVDQVAVVAGSAAEAAGSASEAAQSALTASGAANYQGDYDAGTLYAVGESVSYTGSVFVKKTTAPAGTTPVDGTDWLEIGLSSLPTASTSGASQEISFAASGIHNSAADVATVTYTFANAAEAVKVDLVIDYQVLEAFDMASGLYTGNSLSVQSQDSAPNGIAFNADGTKMFMVGEISDNVYEYDLSTGFDISTASYSGNSFSVSGQDLQPKGVAFNSDGTKMIVLGGGTDRVYPYTLSSAFDVTTATYDGASFSVGSQEGNPRGFTLSPDGTKMYVVGNNARVYEYDLSTSFDVTTAVYSGDNFSVNAQDAGSADVKFSTDGTKMFVMGTANDAVFEYTLSTGFDVSTASYSGNSFSFTGQEATPSGFTFSTNGAKVFILGTNQDTIFEYDCAAGATLVFPTMEKPTIPLRPGEKTALSIVTSDTGSTYQVVSAQGGIV